VLPDITKTKRYLLNRLTLEMRKYVEDRNPAMKRMRSLAQHEGQVHTYERFDAPPVSEGYQEHAAKLEVRMDEVPTLVSQRLAEKLRATADEMARSLGQMFNSKMEQVTTETGNVIDAQGQPFSQDMYLAMLDKVLVDFDEHGNPTIALHAHPTIAVALRDKINEWMRDENFQRRANELWQRKVLEWRDRESNRKLVD
jgi:hypothetical protein